MKTRSRFLVFLAACAVGLLIFGIVRFLINVSREEPGLKAYLSQHELVIPSNSEIDPNILQEKLSKGSLQTWLQVEDMYNSQTEILLQEIERYLIVSILLDLPDDTIVRYTHYYHLVIENESNRLFEDVYVKFPSIEAVEIRRKNSEAAMASQSNGRYIIGEIGPEETVDVYAWNSRPFYIQEGNSIVLRNGNKPVEVMNMRLVGPHSSWVKDNLFLIVILGGLVLFFTQKMAYVIRMCSTNVDPKIGKRLNIE